MKQKINAKHLYTIKNNNNIEVVKMNMKKIENMQNLDDSEIQQNIEYINDVAVDYEVRLNEGSNSCVDLYMSDFNTAHEMGWIELQASRKVSTLVEALKAIADWKHQLEEEVGVYDLL